MTSPSSDPKVIEYYLIISCILSICWDAVYTKLAFNGSFEESEPLFNDGISCEWSFGISDCIELIIITEIPQTDVKFDDLQYYLTA